MDTNETLTQTSSPRASTSDPKATLAPGTILAGRFQIAGLLGRGGMGEVYRAEDLKLHQGVALKFLPEAVAGDAVQLARLLDEVRAARQVTHPNVCRVHDIMEAEGRHFLAMELVDGEDLASLLRRIGRLPQDKGLQIARQTAAALAAVHARGILHRDLKPANVMIDSRGEVRLTDFGLAVEEEGARRAEHAGTPAYMSSEQLAGGTASVQSDLFALGLVLYEVFTGRRVFDAGSVTELSRQHRETEPTPPCRLVSELDPAVERVILWCLAKAPDQRPKSALAVLGALPGGDPLAALVAAGETPSPQMVADGGGVGALRPARAWACIALLALLVPLAIWAGHQLVIFRHINLDKPPAVLEERARQILSRFGHDAPIADSASDFQTINSAALQAVLRDPTPERLKTLPDLRPAPLEFQARVAAEPLWPHNASSQVTYYDPAPIRVGMAVVRLDPRGRLLFYRDELSREKKEESRKPLEWASVLAEASLDEARLQPVEPRYHPGVHATSTAAWTDGTIRVEAAQRDGRLVWFATHGANDRPVPIGRPQARSLLGWLGILGSFFFRIFLLVVPLVLTVRNWRSGRIDLAGANRLGLFVLACGFLGILLTAHHTGSLSQEIAVLDKALADSGLWGLKVWLGYLAIEPFVRRRWPEALISWNRVLAGRIRDPRVGRDVLLGLVAGWGTIGVQMSVRLWHGPPMALASFYNVGAAETLARLSFSLMNAVLYALSVVVLLFVLRRLTRSLWVAMALTVAVGSLIGLSGSGLYNPIPMDYLIYALYGFAAVAILVRLGVFALLAYFATAFSTLPLTTNLGAWYATGTLLAIALTAAFGIYALVVSVGAQPLFGSGGDE